MAAAAQLSRQPVPRRRFFSWRLFRYMLFDFVIVLGSFLVGCFILFLVFSLMDELSEFLDAKSPFPEMARYFLYLQSDNILRILPISLLLATVKCLSTMSKHNEMSALRAAGVSIFQACIPFLLVAVGLAAGQLFISEYLSPTARRQTRAIKRRVEAYGRTGGELEPLLTFRNSADNRTWAMRSFSRNGELTNVSIRQTRADGSVEWELFARTGRFDRQAQVWVFRRARRTRFDEQGIPYGANREVPELSLELSERPRGIRFFFRLRVSEELPARELHDILHEDSLRLPPRTVALLKTAFYDRLVAPLTCIIAVLLGIPLAAATRRTGSMKGFVVAAFLLGAYYMSARFFVVLGSKGILPAVVAAGLAPVIFGAWSIHQVCRKL